jgi:hypothetical protein
VLITTFLVLINDAGFESENRELGTRLTNASNKSKEIQNQHFKYVDDLTAAEAIVLSKTLVPDSENTLEKPLNYHNRTEQLLPPSACKLQTQLNKLDEYANINEMKVNTRKSKVMLFNNSKKNDFTPQMKIDNVTLDVVEEYKLLGVQITSDLKWHSNTKYLVKRSYAKLWLLRRLKAMGANSDELLDAYFKQVRSVLETSAAVWHSGLTRKNTADIERVQKCALSIILGKGYIDYAHALTVLKLKSLQARRHDICLKFARKSYKSEKFKSWFVDDQKGKNTRRPMLKVKKTIGRTNRMKRSPIPYLTSLLNENNPK